MERLLEADIIIGYMTAVGFDPRKEKCFVLWRQEFAVLGKRRNCGPASQAHEYGDASFDDEDPAIMSQ
jgi:hypothetical protein